MRSMVYKSISVVLMIAVGMIIMAAHHEKESDDLASLKEAHNLNWESFKSADIEHTTVLFIPKLVELMIAVI